LYESYIEKFKADTAEAVRELEQIVSERSKGN
jgi:hypothetical protein